MVLPGRRTEVKWFDIPWYSDMAMVVWSQEHAVLLLSTKSQLMRSDLSAPCSPLVIMVI